MSRLAPVAEMAIDMLKKENLTPHEIADSLNLTVPAVRSHLGEVAPMRIVVWDLETTNLRADMGTLLMGSFLDTATGVIETAQLSTDASKSVRDREFELVKEVRSLFVQADILVGQNSKAFDKNYLNGVLARHGIAPLPKRFHIDTMLVARYGMKGLLQSNSLDNLADFFGLAAKHKPSKHHWREAGLLDDEALADIRYRCESDVMLTAAVWECLLPYWLLWKGV